MELKIRAFILQYIVPALAVTFLLLLFIIIRLERDSASYLRMGDDYARRGEKAEAFFYWKMAIQMYVPFSAMPREAAGRLLAAGEEAEKKGNDVEALRAYNYLRSGLLATRHIWQPMPEMTRAAEDRLTSLAPPAERDRQAALLRVRHGTAAAGIPLILVGTLGWPVSMAYLLREWKRGGNIWRWQRFLLPVVFLLSLISGALVS